MQQPQAVPAYAASNDPKQATHVQYVQQPVQMQAPVYVPQQGQLRQPIPIAMPAQPPVQYVMVNQQAPNNFGSGGCFCCGSCLGGWAIVMIVIALVVDSLFWIHHTDGEYYSGVTVHCHRDHATITGWGFMHYEEDYATCEDIDNFTINGDEYDDCEVMQHVGRAWLAFCILSVMAGLVGVVAPCVSSNRWAKRIGAGALFVAGVMALLAVAWLHVGGDENFCKEHGSLSWSPWFVIVFAFVFWGAAGIMAGLARGESTQKKVQVPVPIAVPQAQLGLEMQGLQAVPAHMPVPEGNICR